MVNVTAKDAQTGTGFFQQGHGGGRTLGLYRNDAGMVSAVNSRVGWVFIIQILFVATLCLLWIAAIVGVAVFSGRHTLPASIISLAVLLIATATYQLFHPKPSLIPTAPAA